MRTVLGGLLVALTLAGVGAVPRSADALAFGDVVAPTVSWRVTSSRPAPPGIEILEIASDAPLGHGRVAVVDRTQLHRLRVVLSNEGLVEDAPRRERTTSMCARLHCHVAINGDHWLLNGLETSRPVGALVTNGDLVTTAPDHPWAHLLVGADGSLSASDGPLPFSPVVRTAAGSELPISVNRPVPEDGISLFTGRYGPFTAAPPDTIEYELAVVGDDPEGRALVPLERRVGGGGPIDPTSIVLAARGPAIADADAWWDEAQLGTPHYVPDVGAVREAIGASVEVMEAGAYAFPPPGGDPREPRTLVGWDATRLFLVTVDGRQPGWSVGLSHVESAQLLRWLGATDAVGLDGGGSTTFVEGARVTNRVSDGGTGGQHRERVVANAIVIGPPEGWDFGTPVARTLDAGCPPGRVPAAPFVDLGASTHRPGVHCVAWWGITAGTTPTTYAPDQSVSRAQMASFLARLLLLTGQPIPTEAPDAFADDGRTGVHQPAINALAALGIVAGRADGSYGPDEPVSRAQMATFLARTWQQRTAVPLTHTLDYFGDDGSHPHEGAINATAQAGIVTGRANGSYGGDENVNRGQMGTFLARFLAALVEVGHAAPPG